MSEGLADANPVVATKKNDEVARERVLTENELRTIWDALPAGDHGSIVKLLLLTAQRRLEISNLRWSEIDFEKKFDLAACRTRQEWPRPSGSDFSGGEKHS